jgi:PhnB protein
MKRSMMQIYVKDSNRALNFYQEVFDAEVLCKYPAEDGTLMHAELNIEGQVLAISERNAANETRFEETLTGNTMQFCLQYGAGNEDRVKRVYRLLKTNATVLFALSPCEYSLLMMDLIDQFGIRWCIFV